MSKLSIFFHTQESYAEAVFALFGKGRHHAAKLYADWFRKGHIADVEEWAEPQALVLVQKMIEATDFALPGLSTAKEEGETAKFLLKFSDGLESESVFAQFDLGFWRSPGCLPTRASSRCNPAP